MNIKTFNQKYKNSYPTYILYISCLVIVIIIKLFYSNAGSSSLLFILAPVTKLVETFTGIPFYYMPEIGYLSLEGSIEIGSGCAGINFLVILFCTLVFSFIGQFRGTIKKAALFPIFLLLSYIITVIVNTFRIVTLINVSNLNDAWLGLDNILFHKVTGALIYFFFLTLCYIGISKFTSFLKHKNLERMIGNEKYT